jgi:hypothetical protein
VRTTASLLLACTATAAPAFAQKVCFDQTDYATGSQPSWVAIGDLNEDGTPDLVAANLGADTLSILLGLGNGDFGPAASQPGGATPRSIALGDVTGDGHLDIAGLGPRDQAHFVLASQCP